MQNHRIFTLFLAVIFSLSLAACGGTTATDTPAGDTTATEEASDNGDGGTSADLPESASSTVATGGSMTVGYPSGWTAQAMDMAGSVILTGTEAGQAVTATYLPAAMVASVGDTPSAILSAQSDPLVSAMSGAEIGDVTEVELGGNAAASRTVTVAGVSSYYYVVAVDGGYAFVYGVADQATVEAIAASVSFAN